MKLKLACADFAFPLLEHDQSLQLIATLGFKGVDIGLFEQRSHLWPSREFKNVNRSAGKLKCKLDGVGLKVADVFLQMAPDTVPYAINHPKPARRRKARDWFLKTLDYTSACGGKHVTCTPGVHFEGESYKDSFGRAVDELSWRVEQARQQRLTFAVEAHIGSIAPRPASAERLIKAVPGLTLTLDYTHFTRQGIDDEQVEPLMRHASHFHVRGARKGRLQVNFDQDVIDYRRVYRAMKKANYRGWVGIEYVRTDWERCNQSDNLSETILYRDLFLELARRKPNAR